MKTIRTFICIGSILLIGITSCVGNTKSDKKLDPINGAEIQDVKKIVIQDLCWSPDGDTVYFSAMKVKPDFSDYSSDLWTVYQYDLKTQKIKIIAKSALNVSCSPTGKELALAKNANNERTIYLVDLDGNRPTPLVSGNGKTAAPTWSPNGNQLAFTRKIDDTQEIYTVNKDGSGLMQITYSKGHSPYNPAWSPDGKHIVYYLEKGDGQDQIHVVRSDGKEDRNITNDTLNNIFPGWIDNATIIYGQGHKSRLEKIFQINIDGTNKKQVLNLESFYARYAPDGSKIAYIDKKSGQIKIVASDGELLHEVIVPNVQASNKNSPKLVGGPCEGCEAVFEYGDKKLTEVDTLPDFNEQGLKIKVTGIIYQNDGKTPAKDVVLYIYHTDQKGLYSTMGGETGWAKRHGYNRGWVKTDSSGKYTFYTLKPGVYPDRSTPAHIHPTILEPNGKYYWLESYHFEGDNLLTDEEINPKSPRGGESGLLILTKEGGLWVGTRDIILGKNVPGYD